MHKTIDIKGHQLAYIEHNPSASNPPIIHIHGILDTIRMQETAFNSILRGQRWFSLSLPGHYPAKLAPNFKLRDFTPEFVGDILSQAICQLSGGEPVRLMGHSTGGYACLAVAHTNPDLVEALCLVDGFAQGTWHSLALRPMQIMANLPVIGYPLFWANTTLANGNRFMANLFVRFISHRFATVRADPDYDGVMDTTVSEIKHHSCADLYPYFRKMPSTDIRPWLKDIAIPTLIIHGQYDPVILPAHACEMHNLLPNSEIVWIEDCGHVPFMEQPAAFRDAVHGWLAKMDS